MRHFCTNGIKISAPIKWLCVVCVSLTSLSAAAQTDSIKRLKQVTIQGSNAINTPAKLPTQILNNIDFYRYNAFNVADAIRNFSGVNIRDYGGIGGLKTVSVRSLGANHTAVLFDGVQVNDAQNGQIDLSKFNLTNVQEIELYNGQPSELLQAARSFASGSVLNIKTVQPLLKPGKPYKVQAGIKGGSFGLINPYLQWQQRLSNQWAFIVNTNYTYANGRYKYKVEGDGSDTLAIRRNSEVKAFQTDAELYWAKSDSNKFNIHLNWYNANRGLPGAVIFYNPYSNQRLQNNDLFAQATYQRLWANGLRLLINTKISQLKTRYLDPDFFNEQGYLDQRYNQKELYQSVSVAYKLAQNWDLSYATDVSYTKMEANIYNYAYPSRLTLLNVLSSKYEIGNWQFQGNLLHTYLQETVKMGSAPGSNSILSPTLLVTVHPSSANNFLIRGFYKNIFRPSTLDERYFFAITPRNIKPEFVNQYNLGIAWAKNLSTLVDNISFTADAYYNNVKDKILAIPNKNPAIFSFSNVGRVDIKGIDISLKTQTHSFNGWRGNLCANYTYQLAPDKSDPSSSTYNNQIPYTPKNTLALNAGLNFRKIGVFYNQIISSARYYTSNNTPDYLVPGYAISDASITYRFSAGRMPIIASAEINNLFNKNYSIIRSYPMPGTSFRLSIQITI